jgi:ribose 5-phosphate isomerase B
MRVLKIGIAGDHAGYNLKSKINEYLKEKGYKVTDFGPFNDESSDYADFAHPLAEAIEKKELDLGISMCGSGNGINMTLNKHQDIRSALCWNEEIADLARKHNDANVCALPARFIDEPTAKRIIDVFLNAEFEGGRHKRRIDKIPLKQ